MDLSARLLDHLTQIGRERDPYLNTATYFFVREYIRQELGQWGPVSVAEFTHNTQPHQNLILELPGQQSGPPILIGAHYDAVPGTPGADDNASGVAVLLELARMFSEQVPRSPIRLVAFDLEEYGMIGSGHYAQTLRKQGQPLRLMLSLEMLGYYDDQPGSQQYPPGLAELYPDRGNFIALVGNPQTLPDLQHLSQHLKAVGAPCEFLPVANRGLDLEATRLSDHSPFWDQDYPALMVTDTSFLRNPHYHKASDRIDTLNLDLMAAVCQGLFQGLQHL